MTDHNPLPPPEEKIVRRGMMVDITPAMRDRVAGPDGNFIADATQTRPRATIEEAEQEWRPEARIGRVPNDVAGVPLPPLPPASMLREVDIDDDEEHDVVYRNEPTDETVICGDIGAWWGATSAADLEAFLPKFQEYGAHDLMVIGKGLNPELSDAQATEAGIAFYLLGKAARMVEAYRHGRSASADSWHDATVYSMMGRRVQNFGSLQ